MFRDALNGRIYSLLLCYFTSSVNMNETDKTIKYFEGKVMNSKKIDIYWRKISGQSLLTRLNFFFFFEKSNHSMKFSKPHNLIDVNQFWWFIQRTIHAVYSNFFFYHDSCFRAQT